MSELFPRRRETIEDLQEKLQKAELEIDRLEQKLKSPFGLPTLATTRGHKLTRGMALIRKPFFSASIADDGWPSRFLNALVAAKKLGFTIFEVDLSSEPTYKDGLDIQKEVVAIIEGTSPINGLQEAQLKLQHAGVNSLKSPVYINGWALILGGKE